jgi:hypothetical protein
MVGIFQRLAGPGRSFVAADLSLLLEIRDGGVEYRLRWESRTSVVEMKHMRAARRLQARTLQVKVHVDIQSLLQEKLNLCMW